ncbi:MAG TPA: hypothetical protein VJ501_00750 [Burkholderiaceae bacterium]|nr:hypothetical protein [Burkholderiaceae bacterium]
MKRRFFEHRAAMLRANIAIVASVMAFGAAAQDRAEIDRAQIIGNRELPKVLYIVPWKKPLPGDLSSRPLDSVLDEALAPVDRDVFRRQVRYDAVIESRAAAPNSTAAPSAVPVTTPK